MAIPVDSRRKTSHKENVSILKDYLKRIKQLEKASKAPKVKPKAKPKPVATKPAPVKPKLIETDLAALSGVTKKQAETLALAGIPNIRTLSTTSPRRVTRMTDLKRDRAEKLVETAKQYMREKAKVARVEKAKEPQITALKHLPEITRDDVKRLKELGVEVLDDLKGEDPRDLSLLTGIPEKRIKEWKKVIRGLRKE